jgi:hypothetical protein
LVKDYKKKRKNFCYSKNTQDILSAFYYLRNYPNIDKISPGSLLPSICLYDETTKFKLKFVGREDITTKFGVVSSMVLSRWYNQGVFLKSKSLTVWISDDNNRLPIRIKADLAVGSIKADLEEFKG